VCWSTTSHLHICHNNGEITLPAFGIRERLFVKDYEDVFSETEAGMLSQSILIGIRNRRISLSNLSEKELKIFMHSSLLFRKKGLQLSLIATRCPWSARPLTGHRLSGANVYFHDHNRIRIRKPSIRIRKPSAPATENISIKLYDTLWPSQYASYLSSVH
jgi:hypothetical protein